MLKRRTLTTLVTLPLLVAAVWFDSPIHWFTLLIVLWGGVAVLEFYGMIARAKTRPLMYFGLAWAILLVATADPAVSSAVEPYLSRGQVTSFILATATVVPLICTLWLEPRTEAFARWAWTLAGIVYIGGLLSLLVALRGTEDGRNWVYFVFLTTFASDTSAFLFGRALGRRKLAPTISPAKTWEGAVAGAVGAMLMGLVFIPSHFGQQANPLLVRSLGLVSAPLLALAVSVFGQFGDVVESLFKRNVGAKDSGRLLPGHGGALDRLDSIVFAGVVVYYYVVWLTR